MRDFAELNAYLRQWCQEDQARRLRGKDGTKATLLKEDQSAFLPLPAAPFEACRKVSTTANSLSLVRFDSNDYSVPVRLAHHPVVVHGFCQQVIIHSQGEEIARHARLWSKEDVCFEPLH